MYMYVLACVLYIHMYTQIGNYVYIHLIVQHLQSQCCEIVVHKGPLASNAARLSSTLWQLCHLLIINGYISGFLLLLARDTCCLCKGKAKYLSLNSTATSIHHITLYSMEMGALVSLPQPTPQYILRLSDPGRDTLCIV